MILLTFLSDVSKLFRKTEDGRQKTEERSKEDIFFRLRTSGFGLQASKDL